MTFDSAYMAKVGVLRTGLCAGHPALKEILVSLVRGQLLARLTHVIDDDNTARYLESLMVEDATLHTAMSAGGTHLDAIGTSRDELLSNDIWSTRTQIFRYPPAHLLFQTYGERSWIQRKLFDVRLRTSMAGDLLFYDGGTWHVVHTFLKHLVKQYCVTVAADTGSLYSLVINVLVEAKGQLANNDRPGDIADLVKGKQFSIDVFAA